MASRWGSYTGRILDVNLTTGAVSTYEVSDDEREKYLGGKVLSAHILWRELAPGVDPLSPDNIMVFMTGPLAGTNAPCSARFNLSTKSVLTGGIASSNSGGTLGIRLKKAGWDGLIIRGAADRPTRLDIDGDTVSLLDASDLWGKDAEISQEGLGKVVGSAAIGPAGENLVRFACIMCGDRAFGRTGVGAVMGSKRLKLITVRGSAAEKLSFPEPEALKAGVKKWIADLKAHSVTGNQLPRFGTAGLVTPVNANRALPTRNFQEGQFDGAESISGEQLAKNQLIKNIGCSSCPIHCGRLVQYKGRKIKGPEFETIGMFGSSIGNADMDRIIEWNYLCDIYGLDTISAGSTIACAMELEEKGHLRGSGLRFGSPEGVSEMLRKMAYREGLGADLAEGSQRLAEKYGAPQYAMHSKGLEFAAYEPRSAVGHGLGYATSNRGGCHLNGGYLIYLEALGSLTMNPFTTNGKAELAVMQQNTMEALSASGNCIFTTYMMIPDIPPKLYNPHGASARVVDKVLQSTRFLLKAQGRMKASLLPLHLPSLPHTKVTSIATGMNLHMGNFLAVGERGYTLERLFNLREGLMGESDSLPPRMTDEPLHPGQPNSVVRLTEMVPRYYQVRDWDANGIPTKRLLEKLGLDFAIPEAERIRRTADDYRARHAQVRAHEGAVLNETLQLNRIQP